MERKALEKLVSALVDKEHANNRVQAIENALMMAYIALWGENETDEKELADILDNLGVQLVLEKLARDGIETHQAMVNSDSSEVAHILATTNPVIGSVIGHTVRRLLETEDYQIN